MTNRGFDREVEARLSETAVRYTSGRRRVVGALAAADGPRSADELHRELGSTVPLSSIYRTLAVLQTANVVVPHFSAKGVTRYELAEWLMGHHHHLICIDCGVVEDIPIPQPLERQVRELVEVIGSRVAFKPVNHALEIEGTCGRCA
ncbi:MAG: transcriptional repressor [Acidimicrobiia bacterium]|nr:transcriptional repressor [Acidimicrobiia bacterium]